jgi:tetratricopeptide (TPR) repeat protein
MMKNYNKNYDEAIQLYKSSLKFYNNHESKFKVGKHSSVLFSLSSAFKSLKLYDSAFYYNNKAYVLAGKYRDSIVKGYAKYHSH